MIRCAVNSGLFLENERTGNDFDIFLSSPVLGKGILGK